MLSPYNFTADNFDPNADAKLRRPKLQKLASIDSIKSNSSEGDSGSEDSVVLDEKKVEDFKPTTWQIMKLCEPEKWLMVGGVMAAIAVGSSFPCFAILFGETYGVSVFTF